jgi:hypothetical protein
VLRKLAPAAVVTVAVIAGGLCAAAPAQAADSRAYAVNGRVLCPGGVKPTAAVAMELKVGGTVTDSFDTEADGTFARSATSATGLGFESVTLTATAPQTACGVATKQETVPLGARMLGVNLLPALLGSGVTITLTAAQSVV